MNSRPDSETKEKNVSKADAKESIARISLRVSGMSCSGCEMKVERILLKLNGVKDVKASFSGNTVNITYDNKAVSIGAMASSLGKAGYMLETKARL